MKIYLAAMYQWMDRMKVEREKFRTAGFTITSQWIDSEEETKSRNDAARMDLDDIVIADVFVLYTLDKGTSFISGGRMVEFGYALALGKRCIIIGDRENVFCHLNEVRQFSTTEDVIRHLSIRVGRTLDGHELRVSIKPGMNESDILALLTGSIDPELERLRA